MDPKVGGHSTGPATANLSEDQKRQQRAKLIKALSRFKPKDATPQQFYNCVREICIMHNCKIEEGLERAALTWPGLSKRQREIYDSKRHAELPIPVPRGIQRFKDADKQYDNLVTQNPKVAAMLLPPPPTTRTPLATESSVSNPTPSSPQPSKSLTRILKLISSEISIPRRRQPRGNPRVKNKLTASKSGKAAPKNSINRSQKKKTTKPMTPQAKKLAKEKDLKTTFNNWEQAVGTVQRRILKSRV